MAQRRQEERERKAELYRLDNEECGEEEEEEEDMTDESEEEEVRGSVFSCRFTRCCWLFPRLTTSPTVFTRTSTTCWVVTRQKRRRKAA